MPTKLSIEEALTQGIEPYFDLMENGERRYRLNSVDGTSYCRTEASEFGAWQSSHYHKWMTEIDVVQAGWTIYAEYHPDSGCKLRRLEQWDSVIGRPLVAHNIYMSAGSVTHTIKYGPKPTDIDWFPSPELGAGTKNLSKTELKNFPMCSIVCLEIRLMEPPLA